MLDFEPNEAQRGVLARAQTLADEVWGPAADALDRRGGFPHDNLRQAAARGLLGIGVPAELGGLGAGTVAYSLAVTALARACAGSTVALCVSNMVAEVVTAFGTRAQASTHVPKLCRGDYVVGAFALSESGAGSDPVGMRTRARKTDGGWVLDGSKLWITSGTDAGLFVVWAKTSDDPGARGITAFLVPGDTPGLSRGKPEHKLGLNGSTTTAIEFSGCEVGDDALLGEVGGGFKVAMMALDGGRIGIASQALGIGRAATDTALRHAQTPDPDGSTPGGDQGVQWLLADSATELSAARLLTLRAAWLKDAKRPFSHEASMAKLYASEKAVTACDRALSVMGGAGFRRGSGVERNFRDVRVTTIYEGTSEVQRIVLSRGIVRRFAEA